MTSVHSFTLPRTTVGQVWETLWLDAEFARNVKEDHDEDEIAIGSWRKVPDSTAVERETSSRCAVRVTGLPPHITNKNTQSATLHDDKTSINVVETVHLVTKVPYSDYFNVKIIFKMSEVSDGSGVLVEIILDIEFVKYTMLKSRIEKGTISEGRKNAARWEEIAKHAMSGVEKHPPPTAEALASLLPTTQKKRSKSRKSSKSGTRRKSKAAQSVESSNSFGFGVPLVVAKWSRKRKKKNTLGKARRRSSVDSSAGASLWWMADEDVANQMDKLDKLENSTEEDFHYKLEQLEASDGKKSSTSIAEEIQDLRSLAVWLGLSAKPTDGSPVSLLKEDDEKQAKQAKALRSSLGIPDGARIRRGQSNAEFLFDDESPARTPEPPPTTSELSSPKSPNLLKPTQPPTQPPPPPTTEPPPFSLSPQQEVTRTRSLRILTGGWGKVFSSFPRNDFMKRKSVEGKEGKPAGKIIVVKPVDSVGSLSRVGLVAEPPSPSSPVGAKSIFSLGVFAGSELNDELPNKEDGGSSDNSQGSRNCPGKHGLRDYNAPRSSGPIVCQRCSKAMPAGGEFRGCKSCSIVLCLECADNTPVVVVNPGETKPPATFFGGVATMIGSMGALSLNRSGDLASRSTEAALPQLEMDSDEGEPVEIKRNAGKKPVGVIEGAGANEGDADNNLARIGLPGSGSPVDDDDDDDDEPDTPRMGFPRSKAFAEAPYELAEKHSTYFGGTISLDSNEGRDITTKKPVLSSTTHNTTKEHKPKKEKKKGMRTKQKELKTAQKQNDATKDGSASQISDNRARGGGPTSDAGSDVQDDYDEPGSPRMGSPRSKAFAEAPFELAKQHATYFGGTISLDSNGGRGKTKKKPVLSSSAKNNMRKKEKYHKPKKEKKNGMRTKQKELKAAQTQNDVTKDGNGSQTTENRARGDGPTSGVGSDGGDVDEPDTPRMGSPRSKAFAEAPYELAEKHATYFGGTISLDSNGGRGDTLKKPVLSSSATKNTTGIKDAKPKKEKKRWVRTKQKELHGAEEQSVATKDENRSQTADNGARGGGATSGTGSDSDGADDEPGTPRMRLAGVTDTKVLAKATKKALKAKEAETAARVDEVGVNHNEGISKEEGEGSTVALGEETSPVLKETEDLDEIKQDDYGKQPSIPLPQFGTSI